MKLRVKTNHRVLILAIGSLFAIAASAQQASDAGKETAAPIRHIAVCSAAVPAEHARCHSRVVVDSANQLVAAAAPSGLTPANLRSAYKITGTGSSSTLIAIVDAFGYPNAESDLAVYRAQFGLPPCTTANGCFKKVNQSGVQGNYPRTDKGWSQESALDLDMASAMCPGCSLILVEATTNGFQDLAMAVNQAAAMGAHVISNSYGGGESGSAPYEQFYNYAGVAVTVSSGDRGYGVQFPASSPHVTAVGGTHLVRDSSTRGWTESAWSGAGSGCSVMYGKPTWQKDTGCAKRTVADVSAVADPATGVAVYGPATLNRSAWLKFGGTSVAAPLIGGIYGLNGGGVNYGSDPYHHPQALFDVTTGSNGTCGGSYLCTAGPGYDGPTGLGTPRGFTGF